MAVEGACISGCYANFLEEAETRYYANMSSASSTDQAESGIIPPLFTDPEDIVANVQPDCEYVRTGIFDLGKQVITNLIVKVG